MMPGKCHGAVCNNLREGLTKQIKFDIIIISRVAQLVEREYGAPDVKVVGSIPISAILYMNLKKLNKSTIKAQSEILWKQQKFKKLLQDKILYVLEHGDVMIDSLEIKKF